MNPYAYSYSNPTNYTDPSGLAPPPLDLGRILRDILSKHTGDKVEALAQFYVNERVNAHPSRIRDDARERTAFIIKWVSNSAGIPVPISPLAIRIDGQGLNPVLDDRADNQMNHFLTAVQLALDPSFLDVRIALPGTSPASEFPIIGTSPWVYPVRDALGLAYDEIAECSALRMIIGHELRPDDLGSRPETWQAQVGATQAEHFALFLQAVHADENGIDPDPYLAEIFDDGRGPEGYYNPYDSECSQPAASNSRCPWGTGNSMQDLRLSVKGYRFGQEVERLTLFGAAVWLREELK